MITSHCLQRMALSAALLVLPLLNYCGEISEKPYPEAGSVEQVEPVTSSGPSAALGTQDEEAVRTRQILADMENRKQSGF